MKKSLLILLLFILTGGYLRSQSLTLYNGAEAMNNGDTLLVLGELSSDLFYEVVAHVKVKNNTDRSVSVLVHRITHDTITGSVNQFCWVQCFAPWVDVAPTAFEIPPFEMAPEETFSGHYLPQGKLGTSILEYTFYIESNPTDSVSFVAKFKVTPSSVNDWKENIRFGNAYPNPATAKVNFDFDLSAIRGAAKIKISNLLGQTLIEKNIEQRFGSMSIPVDQLREGVYFYSLVIEDQIVSSKKLVIKK